MEINHSLSIAMDLYWIRFIDLLFYNSLLDGVPEYRDICRKGYESGLITRIISATCCQLSGNHCLSEYMAFLCRKQRKKNKHQSTKKGNDMELRNWRVSLNTLSIGSWKFVTGRTTGRCTSGWIIRTYAGIWTSRPVPYRHSVITVPCLFPKSITRYSTSRKMCRVSSRKLRTEEKRLFTEDVTYNS